MKNAALALLSLVALACFAFAQQNNPDSSGQGSPADSMQTKLDWMKDNATKTPPDSKPTEFSEAEINDYLAKDVKLPNGVQSVQLTSSSGIIHGHATVNFDALTANSKVSPLMMMFSGTHVIDATASASGSGGTGKVHVQSVMVDGVNVPTQLIQVFVTKYVTPKYPNVGLDSQFQMPEKIDQATVGEHQLTVVQK